MMKSIKENCENFLDGFDVNEFQKKLLQWWDKHGRVFPWRFEKDPYRILIAEIFLHRTNSSQVEKIYNKFIGKFPDIESLLNANEKDISFFLNSLGLKWRQDLFKKMLLILKNKYQGKIPLNYEDLRALPGIGDYIAAAIIIFTQNTPLPLLDTNIVRIVGRLFCLKITDSSRRSKLFRNYIYCTLYRKDPRIFYYALIDFAALVCKSEKPDCNNCPLRNFCCFYKNQGR